MAELILYVDGNFGGLYTHIFGDTPHFSQLALGGNGSGIFGNWNDRVSSFVIVSGKWRPTTSSVSSKLVREQIEALDDDHGAAKS